MHPAPLVNKAGAKVPAFFMQCPYNRCVADDVRISGFQRTFATGVVVAVLTALLLVAVEVARHRASIQSNGKVLLAMDIALLLVYAIAAVTVCRNRTANFSHSLRVGALLGLVVGTVHIANHVIENFVLERPFVLVIIPVFLTFALFGTAGSMGWERTRSLPLAVISGVACAMVTMLVLICLVLLFDMAFENRAQLPLHYAFLASGMSDPGAFLVRNTLQAASEGLVRMPILALFLSFTGALMSFWFSRQTRNIALAIAAIAPIVFFASVAALWYANALVRASRPPFVMFGALSAGISLCCVYPAWSTLRMVKQ